MEIVDHQDQAVAQDLLEVHRQDYVRLSLAEVQAIQVLEVQAVQVVQKVVMVELLFFIDMVH